MKTSIRFCFKKNVLKQNRTLNKERKNKCTRCFLFSPLGGQRPLRCRGCHRRSSWGGPPSKKFLSVKNGGFFRRFFESFAMFLSLSSVHKTAHLPFSSALFLFTETKKEPGRKGLQKPKFRGSQSPSCKKRSHGNMIRL